MAKESTGLRCYKHLIQEYPELSVEVDRLQENGWEMSSPTMSKHSRLIDKNVEVFFRKSEAIKPFSVLMSPQGKWEWHTERFLPDEKHLLILRIYLTEETRKLL